MIWYLLLSCSIFINVRTLYQRVFYQHYMYTIILRFCRKWNECVHLLAKAWQYPWYCYRYLHISETFKNLEEFCFKVCDLSDCTVCYPLTFTLFAFVSFGKTYSRDRHLGIKLFKQRFMCVQRECHNYNEVMYNIMYIL